MKGSLMNSQAKKSRGNIALFKSGLSAVLAVCIGLVFSGCGSKGQQSGPPVFYPPQPNPPRLQFLRSFTSKKDLKRKSGFEKFVLGEEKGVVLIKPYGVAMYNGVIYVCDTGQGTVFKLDIANKEFKAMGEKKKGVPLISPINIAFDENGDKYIADSGQSQILVFGPGDNLIRRLGFTDQFRASDVLVTSDRVYVCDIKDHEVEVLDKKSGDVLFTIGERGSEEGQFNYPTNLAMDPNGNLYVCDTGNFRVQKFDRDGNYLSSIGSLGKNIGQFSWPKGLATARDGTLYVVDSRFYNVQMFNDEGELLMHFPDGGQLRGHLNLPADVSISYNGLELFQEFADKDFVIEYLVLVTNQYGPWKVNVYGFGHSKNNTYDDDSGDTET